MTDASANIPALRRWGDDCVDTKCAPRFFHLVRRAYGQTNKMGAVVCGVGSYSVMLPLG
ncbi:MAG: hypothetical protein ACK56I_09290 [bacterium]